MAAPPAGDRLKECWCADDNWRMRGLIAHPALATAVLALAAISTAPSAPAATGPADLIAPASACPEETGNAGAPAAPEEREMLCMTNFARRHAGLAALSEDERLDRSAERKSGDILRCQSFSHEACGRPSTYWMERVGYLPAGCWRAGENIAWGTGSFASVRSIFSAWINSRGHRENILGGYRQTGIGLRVGELEGNRDAHVWTQQFGLRC
ncbi:MAG: CAP domain-containing protein [Solirubrobacterales bacterium]